MIWLRRGLIALGVLVVIVAGVVFLGLQLGERRAARHFDMAVKPVTVPTDAAALERGRYLYASRGCAECHGANGAGRAFVDDPKAGVKIAGSNITQRRRGQRDDRVPTGRLGAHDPPRRAPLGAAAAGDAQRGLQPLHRC